VEKIIDQISPNPKTNKIQIVSQTFRKGEGWKKHVSFLYIKLSFIFYPTRFMKPNQDLPAQHVFSCVSVAETRSWPWNSEKRPRTESKLARVTVGNVRSDDPTTHTRFWRPWLHGYIIYVYGSKPHPRGTSLWS